MLQHVLIICSAEKMQTEKQKTSTLGELGLKKMLSGKEPSNQQALNSV